MNFSQRRNYEPKTSSSDVVEIELKRKYIFNDIKSYRKQQFEQDKQILKILHAFRRSKSIDAQMRKSEDSHQVPLRRKSSVG